MPLKRMLGIVLRLLNNNTLTAEELAREFDVSVRTIYKDVASLIEADIPIISDRGPRGGYSLLQSFYLHRDYLSLEDLIKFLRKINKKTGAGNIKDREEAIEKIFAVMPENRGENLLSEAEFNIIPSGYEDLLLNKLKNLTRAVNNDKYLRLAIYKSDRDNFLDLVKPVDIICYNFNWFISVYSRREENYRLYPLSNVENYQILDEISNNDFATSLPDFAAVRSDADSVDSDICQDLNEKAVSYEKNKDISCHLLFSRKAAERVYNLFPEGAIIEDNEKGILIITSWPNNIWIRRTILSFGSEVKVLSPSWLAAEIKATAEQIASQYHDIQEEEL